MRTWPFILCFKCDMNESMKYRSFRQVKTARTPISGWISFTVRFKLMLIRHTFIIDFRAGFVNIGGRKLGEQARTRHPAYFIPAVFHLNKRTGRTWCLLSLVDSSRVTVSKQTTQYLSLAINFFGELSLVHIFDVMLENIK